MSGKRAATAHRPATPLPWRIYEDGEVRGIYTLEISPPPPAKLGERPAVVFWAGFDGNGLKNHQNRQNAQYIIHAANAYQKLVEAIRFLRDYTYTDADGPELRAQNERCHRKCAELLRELGEG